MIKAGTRVCSRIAGFYSGLPGTVVGRSAIDYDNFTHYRVQLDIGKVITLSERYIEILTENVP